MKTRAIEDTSFYTKFLNKHWYKMFDKEKVHLNN